MSRQDHRDTFLPREHDVLSEAELRKLYDDEELERYLSLFSAHVTEIRLSSNPIPTEPIEPHIEDTSSAAPAPLHGRSLSEHIAYNYLLPHLPPATSVTPAFTLKRFVLTIQRVYLAMFPVYHALFLDLVRLALWKDYQRSLRYCIVFWFLWFHDLLLPALVFRIAFHLLKRRLSSYPSLKELQERRHQTEQAQKFQEAVQQRLSTTTIGPVEMWRLFKIYRSEEKEKAKSAVQGATENDEEESLRRDLLFVLNELADLHERIKSIFTWRRPRVSRRYLFFLIVFGFGTMILPSKWISKLFYWFGGTLFWHVVPVIAALPQSDRPRALHLFGDAPTDADHAMELIAKRIAAGQNVNVASLRNPSRHVPNASPNTDNLIPISHTNSFEVQSSEDNRINWRKWSDRVARGKLFVEEKRRFLSSHSANPISGIDIPVETEDVYTYLAQHASFPGLITLTSCTLFFTSLTETHARLVLPRDRLRGVKRTGLVKGISITWAPGGLMDGDEREVKFHWVGNRDELFARLSVGLDGRRWITV